MENNGALETSNLRIEIAKIKLARFKGATGSPPLQACPDTSRKGGANYIDLLL